MFHDLLRDDVLRIETKRLWLRWPDLGNARVLQDIASDARVAEMTSSWPHPLPDGAAQLRIVASRDSNAAGRSVVMALVRKRDPRWFVGISGLHDLGDGRAGLGYLQGSHYSGQGLMSEALAALLRIVVPLSQIETVEASVRLDNPASRCVLEKCGFVRTGTGRIAAPARTHELDVEFFALETRSLHGSDAGRIAA